ncbi:hypothetical protein DYI95_008995 [Thermaerobacter sp. PB12/4term]|uniref:hypothetical protein n=1 Tax=Thermaerobacter sp. PB12/4term TaxID=2293838 RepID=UPI000E3275FA|nr:hypothetical protein [Thermaerobacter sp. PB12/4term]QIA26132.1 hypothetical protein DYI95_008995 [Thermaerobacter sp. PB12/4term]
MPATKPPYPPEFRAEAVRLVRENGKKLHTLSHSAMKAARKIEVGGVKGSGIGREGPRYAIEHLTDLRLVVFNL